MPSIVAESNLENPRLFEPKGYPIGWREEEIARSSHVTTQLRPNGEGGYLRTVRRRSKFACTTTHHRHVIKSSNSYETSKVEDQSKSEGLTIEVNCPPQYQQEYPGRDYDCAKKEINGSSKPKLPEDTLRSFLRIGQHQNESQTNVGAVTRISICNANSTNMQDNCVRPSKMQKVIPTSLIIMDKSKHRNKIRLVDNIQAKDTSYQQFITDEGNRRLRRKIFRSHNYHKTVTKTNLESNENMGSTQIANYKISNEDHRNSFPNYYSDNVETKTSTERQETENDHSISKHPAEIEIHNGCYRHPRNHMKIFIKDKSTIGTQNISTSTTYNSSTQTTNKCELRRNQDPIEIIRPYDTVFTSSENSSNLTESKSNRISSPSRKILQKSFTSNKENLSSTHKACNYHSNSPPSYILSSTATPTLEYQKKHHQEIEQKFVSESNSTLSQDEYALNSKLCKHGEREKIYSPEIKIPPSLPSATFRKISHHESGRWQNKEKWKLEESSSEDFTSQLKHDTSKSYQTWNPTVHKESQLGSCNRRPSKEEIPFPSVYFSSTSGSREESLTDEDRSMNEFVIKQSKQKELTSQYHFGIPTAKFRTRGKKGVDDITSSSSSSLPSMEKLTTEKLISQQERNDYQESWSGSEHQWSTTQGRKTEQMQWSSTNESSDDNSFFKETRTRKGPIEVFFSVKSRCQTRTIAEEPSVKEAYKESPQTVKNLRKEESSIKQNASREKYSDKTHLWGRSANEKENEISFSREVKTSKEPMELRFSVTSFEQQRVLRQNAKNDQTGQSIQKSEKVKKSVEEKKNSRKENIADVEEQTESERKRKKSLKEIRKECPLEIHFSVKSHRKENDEQNNYKQNKQAKMTIPSKFNFEDVARKEETFEEILVSKLSTLKETRKSESKLSTTFNNPLMIPYVDDKMMISRRQSTKKPVVERKNSVMENMTEAKEQTTESEQKRKKSFKNITKECPVEVQFSVNPNRKGKVERNNELEKPTPFQVDLEDVVTKEETFEEMLIRKLTTLRETRKSDSNVSKTTKDLSIVQRTEQGPIPSVTRQPSLDDKKTINQLVNSVIQRENNQRTDNSFKISTKFTDTKERDKSIYNPPLPNPISSNYFKQVETLIMKDLADTKESLSKIITVKSTTNESTDLNERKTYHEIPFSPAEFSSKPASSKIILDPNIEKPNIIREYPLKSDVTEKCDEFSTNFKSSDISKNEITTIDHSTKTFMKNENFAIKHPIKTKECKGIPNSENTLKIIDIASPLKSPIYLKHLLYKTLNTGYSLRSEPDAEVNPKKSNISSYISHYPSNCHSELNAKKTERHLLSSLDTNSEFLRGKSRSQEISNHEYKLKSNEYENTAMDKQISTTDQNTIICYLQPSQRGFKVKSWKEEVLINRMLLEVESIDKSTHNEMQKYNKSNQFFKIAPTDWAQSTDYSFQMTSEINSNACEKTTSKPQGNISCSNATETENIASQRTRDQHINLQKTSTKKRSETEMAENNLRLNRHPKNSNKPNEIQLGLHSIEKELKRNNNKPNIQCIYETSL